MTFSIIQKSQLEGALRLDAEYYQPKYLENNKAILDSGYQVETLGKLIYPVKNGFDFRDFSTEGRPYLRAGDVLSGEVNFRGAAKIDIPAQDVKKEIGLRPGDILFSRKGTYGRAAVVEEDFANAVISSEVMRLRLKPSTINPYFLSSYLNSKYGRLQVEQRVHGISNFSISQEDLKTVKLLILSGRTQSKIEELVKKAWGLLEESFSLFCRAEEKVLNEVGFKQIKLVNELCHYIPLKKAVTDRRLDAEHFHTKFRKLRRYLEKTGKAKPLGELRSFIKRGLQPEYVEAGEIMVINSQHLGRTLLNTESTPRADKKFYEQNERCQLRKNDALLYSTGAYIGRTNAYLDDNKAIASNHVTIIRTTKDCDPVYLAVYLNSPLGLMQTDQWASGSAQREIYPDDIDKFLVYLPSLQFQQKVANLVFESYQARKKSKELLEEAKRRVEEMVEKGG